MKKKTYYNYLKKNNEKVEKKSYVYPTKFKKRESLPSNKAVSNKFNRFNNLTRKR